MKNNLLLMILILLNVVFCEGNYTSGDPITIKYGTPNRGQLVKAEWQLVNLKLLKRTTGGSYLYSVPTSYVQNLFTNGSITFKPYFKDPTPNPDSNDKWDVWFQLQWQKDTNLGYLFTNVVPVIISSINQGFTIFAGSNDQIGISKSDYPDLQKFSVGSGSFYAGVTMSPSVPQPIADLAFDFCISGADNYVCKQNDQCCSGKCMSGKCIDS
jgi:hypothetical protein